MDFTAARDRMIERDLAARGIGDPRLLNAFRAVPRERFLPPELRHCAYDDCALPIARDQTISQPFIVARMIQAAALRPVDHVLEVGAGSGYAAAVMAQMARHVVAVERFAALADEAQLRLRALGIGNVDVVHGDGTLGWPAGARYDAIVCAAAGPEVPGAWWDQLTPDGRIVMPRGDPGGTQSLVVLTASGETVLEPVRFVPLLRGSAN